MSKPKILIASLLKPLRDPRAFYRLGISLRETNKYKINIIGFSIKKESGDKNFKFTGLSLKNRKGFSRIFAAFVFFKTYRKERPELTIFCTWEFIPFALLGKWFYGGKLVYDVQENYAKNIAYNLTLHGTKKTLAKFVVNSIENLSQPFIDHYIFSEHCYIKEKPDFKPFTVLENKFQGPIGRQIRKEKLQFPKFRFLISGTITEVYGVREAINWFKELQKIYPDTNLHVIGHCPLPSFEKVLFKLTEDSENILLELSENPVPYPHILEAYRHADVVLMPYFQLPSIREKIPSKLYECLALRFPFIFSKNPQWESIAESYNAGIAIDFLEKGMEVAIMQKLLNSDWYDKAVPEEALWVNKEEAIFQDLVAKLLSSKP
jgi:glycosyltransferase involved in cell wall biosynthesis